MRRPRSTQSGGSRVLWGVHNTGEQGKRPFARDEAIPQPASADDEVNHARACKRHFIPAAQAGPRVRDRESFRGEISVSPRVIAALRELADALEEATDAEPMTAEPHRRAKQVRRPRVPVAPAASSVSDVDRAAARAFLRRNGFVEVK